MAVSFSFSNSCLAWLHGSACTKIWRLRGPSRMEEWMVGFRIQNCSVCSGPWLIRLGPAVLALAILCRLDVPSTLEFPTLPKSVVNLAGWRTSWIVLTKFGLLKQEMHQLLSDRSCYWRPEIGTRCDQRHFPLHHLRPVNTKKALLLSIIVVV